MTQLVCIDFQRDTVTAYIGSSRMCRVKIGNARTQEWELSALERFRLDPYSVMTSEKEPA